MVPLSVIWLAATPSAASLVNSNTPPVIWMLPARVPERRR